MDTRARRRLPRLGLLLAAVLHLVGAAVLAPLHAVQPQDQGASAAPVASETPREAPDRPDAPEPHDASHCVFCLAAGSGALPATLPAAASVDGATPAASAPAPATAPTPFARRASARAPPAAA